MVVNHLNVEGKKSAIGIDPGSSRSVKALECAAITCAARSSGCLPDRFWGRQPTRHNRLVTTPEGSASHNQGVCVTRKFVFWSVLGALLVSWLATAQHKSDAWSKLDVSSVLFSWRTPRVQADDLT